MSTSNLKKVNLEHLARPKTLIVIHYKGRRISIPLFECYQNITEYLYHQLHKFQVTVLENQTNKHKSHSKDNSSLNKLFCFTAKEEDNNKLDLKMNILLSMSRLAHDEGRSRLDLHLLDITLYYKFMEIQSYYCGKTKELIPEYQLYSVLSQCPQSTTYLGRRISDGRFFSVKFWRIASKLGQRQFNSFKILAEEQTHVINRAQLESIPEVEEVRKTEEFLIIIAEFCPGGTLRQYVKKKIPELQCLHFMKQLIWGVYTLHEKYNLMHRALCFQNICVDFLGNLRIFGLQHSQPSYASNYLINSQVPQAYEQSYIITNVIVPPEVTRSSHYNLLVDYFNVGTVLYELYFGYQPGSDKQRGKEEKEGIVIAIESLMSDNLRDRELFANQIISQIHEQKIQKSTLHHQNTCLQNQRLTLNKIQTGKSINLQESPNNDIDHQQAIKIMKPSNDDQIYYLNPKGKKRIKSKQKSKSKSKDKNNYKISSKQKSRISQSNKSNSISKNSSNTSLKSYKKQSIKNSKSKSKNKESKSNKVTETGQKVPISKEKNTGKSKEKKNLCSPPKLIASGCNFMKSPPKSRPNALYTTTDINMTKQRRF